MVELVTRETIYAQETLGAGDSKRNITLGRD